MGQVIAGMAAQGCNEFTTACLLTSRSVTRIERAHVTEQLVGGTTTTTTTADTNKDKRTSTTTSTSTTSIRGNAERALVVAQPVSTQEIVQATVSAGGNVIYAPASIDLARGEGLLESLGPAMQVIVRQGLQQSASLWVVVDNPEMARQQLQGSIQAILPRLVVSSTTASSSSSSSAGQGTISCLEDVFASVRYVTPTEALETLTRERQDASAAASRVAIASKTGRRGAASSSMLSPADLAIARTWGPAARVITADAVATVRGQINGGSDDDGDGAQRVVVVDFGSLAAAAMQAARDKIAATMTSTTTTTSSTSTTLASQMLSAATAQMEFDLYYDFQVQLNLLSEQTFAAFRKSLSKVIIGPNLAADMQAVAQTHLQAFDKQARRLVARGTQWSTRAATAALQTRLRETVTSRLATARASGKFRPLPRKGVTVGLHWLLPKPFGNDYRQEPWLVHASDNLVYVPPDGVTEVNPQAVRAGDDWRNQIVPSPVGNDMIFMQ